MTSWSAARPVRTSTSGAPRDAMNWPAVLSLMAAGAVAAAQIGKGSAALPVLQAEFGLGPSAAAWFLSVVSALGAVGGALLGWLGQAVGFRRQVQIGLLAIALCSTGGAFVPSAGWLLAARVGEGFGLVVVVLAAPGLLPEMSAPLRRRLVVGAWGAYMPVGAGLATLLVPPAIPLLGWRGTWLMDGAFAAGVLLAVTRWVPRPRARRPVRATALVTAVRSPALLSLVGLFAVYAAQYLAVVGLLPAVLVNGGLLGLATAGVVGSLVFLVNAPGNVLGATLMHRGVSPRRLVLAASVVMATTVWGVLDPDLPLLLRIACAMAFSFAAGLVPAAIFNCVAALSAGGPLAGASLGLLMQGSSLGQLFGPPLVVAAVSAVGSWTAGPAVLSCLALAAALLGSSWRDPDGPRPDGRRDS